MLSGKVLVTWPKFRQFSPTKFSHGNLVSSNHKLENVLQGTDDKKKDPNNFEFLLTRMLD